MKKKSIIGFGLLLLCSFAALNIAVFLFGSSQVFDLTAEQKYTLSPSTLRFLKENKKNLYVCLYKSADLQRQNPYWADYTAEVVKLLEQYQLHSEHRLGLQIVEVRPFSVQEAEARSLGIEELPAGNGLHPGFLGLVISDDAGHMRALPFLNPERSRYLEQDITRLLSNLDGRRRTDVGILSPAFKVIPSDDAFDHTAPWPIAELLARDYDLSYVNPQTAQIPFNVDVLLVVNPVELPNTALYAIDQFLMFGGRVIMFVDALSEYMLSRRLMPPQMLSVSYLPEFLQQLGITFIPDTVIGDMSKNRAADVDGVSGAYPFWLGITPELFAKHPITDGVAGLAMNSASRLIVSPQPGIKTRILAATSADGAEVNNAELSHRVPGQTLKTLRATDGKYPLAVLLEGKFNSYFKVPYVNAVKEVPFVSISLDKSSLLVVADSDMLLAAAWNGNKAPRQEWYHMTPENGNTDFLFNAIDYLAANDTPVSVAPKASPYAPQPPAEVFAAEARQSFNAARRKTAEEINQTAAELQDIALRIENNELMPSLKCTRQIEKLERNKLRLQKEMQRIDYLTAQKYRSLVNRFVILNLAAALAIAVLICLVQELWSRRVKRQAKEYVNE